MSTTKRQEQPVTPLPERLSQPLLGVGALSERQRALVAEAWDVDPEYLFHSLWNVDHSVKPVAYLITVCRNILSDQEPAVELPASLVRILRDDILEALTRGQRRVVLGAWLAQSNVLRHSMRKVEDAQSPVRYLMRVCDDIITDYSTGEIG